tara:strand:+ start:531 stop:1460 length:930 start_codon:yes stop_codon:yes gene_type:complete
MNIVVFGASGYIGSHLVEKLLCAGHDVFALVHRGKGLLTSNSINHKNITIKKIDICNPQSVKDACKLADQIINLSSNSVPQSSNKDPKSDLQVNLIGALNILDAAKDSKGKNVIMISSGGTVYGKPQALPINENHPTQPICSYGITKLAIEKYLYLYKKIHNINGLALRISNPYGGAQRINHQQGVIPNFLQKSIKNEVIQIWGDGNIVRDFIYISDVIDAIISALNYTGDDHVINIGSGHGYSLLEIIKLIEIISEKKVAYTTSSQRISDVDINILDIKKAKLLLNWEPKITIKEGLKLYYKKILSCN